MRRLITALGRIVLAAAGQCGICGAWLDDWNGGTCDACS